ncbi:MAG TPA: DPP IV N-terminal domain-containing protein, partial [Niabella sp.]|nr:DPP IV N-terminal domain-containing protein [Niabella sp.]
MQKLFFLLLFGYYSLPVSAQNKLAPLTVQKIMRDPRWMGSSPSQPQWNRTGDTLYFLWNPDKKPADSLYFITLKNNTPQKATVAQRQLLSRPGSYVYNLLRTRYVFEKNGDIFFTDIATSTTRRITHTIESENNPQFSFGEKKIVYTRNSNLYAWDIATGETEQLTNIGTSSNNFGSKPSGGKEEDWLKNDQLVNFDVLRERKAKNDTSDAYRKALPKEKELRYLLVREGSVRGLNISPDGRFVSYRTFKPATTKNTIIPDYVTESGYTTDISGRNKVGAEQGSSAFYVYDRER